MSKKLEILKEFLNNYEGILKSRIEYIEQFNALQMMDEIIPFNITDEPNSNTSLTLNKTHS